MAAPNNTPVVGLSVGLLVLVSCSVSEACWCKKRSAAPVYTNPCPSYTYPDPFAPAVGPAIGDRTDFSIGGLWPPPPPPPPPPCPPGMVYAYCDTEHGLWRQTSYATSEGCVLESLIGTPCTGAGKGKGPKDDEAKGKEDVRERIEPMVCDVQTRKFRRPNPGETPHAYLPARYLGKPCSVPKQ